MVREKQVLGLGLLLVNECLALVKKLGGTGKHDESFLTGGNDNMLLKLRTEQKAGEKFDK